MTPKISIIVPAYNAQNFLNKCLESVTMQTLKEIEIILVNDGSADKTLEICDKWARIDARIQLINQPNKGVAEARNAGMALATAPYIGFVDSDDWIEPDMFEQMYAQILKTNADICVCGVLIERLHNTKKTDRGKKGVVSKKEAMYKLLYDARWHSFFCNKLFRIAIWGDTKFPPGKVFEDFAIQPAIFHKADVFTHTGTFLYHYRQQPESIGHTPTVEKSFTFFNLLCERYIFAEEYALFNNRDKKQITLRLQKRMVKTFRDIIQLSAPDEFLPQKEWMCYKIKEVTGNPYFNEKQIKKQLRKILFLRMLAKMEL